MILLMKDRVWSVASEILDRKVRINSMHAAKQPQCIVPTIVPGPAVTRIVGGEVLGTPDVAPVTLLDERTRQALGVGDLGVGQFGDAEDVEELIIGERGGNLSRPLAFLQRPEGGGGEPGEALLERKLSVHPVEALGVGRVVPNDPIEVIWVQPIKLGAESFNLNPQPQPVCFRDRPPVLPFLRAEFGMKMLEFEPFWGKTPRNKC